MPIHHNVTSDGEEFRMERDIIVLGSEDSSDEQQDGTSAMLPDAALEPDGSPDTSSPSETQEGMLPRDVQQKTAYYDYAADKQLSQEDAKLFYQRSKLEAQKTGGSNWGTRPSSPHGSPVILGRNFPSVFDSEQAGIRKIGSMTSMQSGRNTMHGSVMLFLVKT
jgi:AMP deaminase